MTDARQRRIDKAMIEQGRRRRAAMLGEDVEPAEFDMRQEHVMRGVTLTWLQHVFKRDRQTAKQLLIDCPVLRTVAGGGAVYDVAEAAQYLVKPKLDVKRLLGTLKEADLPDDLKPKVWQARLSEQRWKLRAGALWEEADILSTFAETFKVLKETMQLWADDMGENVECTQAQRDYVVGRVDELQKHMHQALIELSKRRRTPSSAEKEPDDE